MSDIVAQLPAAKIDAQGGLVGSVASLGEVRSPPNHAEHPTPGRDDLAALRPRAGVDDLRAGHGRRQVEARYRIAQFGCFGVTGRGEDYAKCVLLAHAQHARLEVSVSRSG